MKTIQPWIIYLWRNGDKYEGASPIKTKDNIKDIYCFGWEIETDPEAKRNEDKHKAWRARNKVKNLLNNTLNVINWHGKKVLDNKGNVDPEKLSILEMQAAKKLAPMNAAIAEKNKKLPKKEREDLLDLDDYYPIRKFPIKDITLQQAKKYGFKKI